MKRKILAIVSAFVALGLGNVFATPQNIIITRHGEKVIPHGFCLDLQGLERASTFPHYFTEHEPYAALQITHVFAAYDKNPAPYIRCQQTCQPTADFLKLPLNLDFKPEQIKEIAQEILTNPKYDKANLLLCWEHRHIRPLVMALGAEDPGFWAENIFDQVYMLTFDGNSKPKFQQFLQKLLFGDRATIKDQPTPSPSVSVKCPEVK
ncbi:MAG: histidine phosphatase family protein [Proteobacteria bacterium]|nr:histidine phosphatase family protein [Pseudomonadota bacterium]